MKKKFNRGEAQSGLAQQSPKLPSVGSNPITPAKIKKINLIAGEQLFSEAELSWNPQGAETLECGCVVDKYQLLISCSDEHSPYVPKEVA